MNIKKSPLMAGLLTLNAIFGAMVGKAEAPKYSITHEDMGNIFTNQTEVASFQVNGVDVHVMTGWKHTQKWLDKDENGDDVLLSRTLTAPFVVGKDGAAFTGAFSSSSFPADIKTVAVNEDNGRVYAFKAGEQTDFYEINLGTNGVTATQPLQVLHQLSPSVTTNLGFHSANDSSSRKQETIVDQAIAWSDGSKGEFILTYDQSSIGSGEETTIWHRNGVVNVRGHFAGIEPVEVIKGQNVIYYGDGQQMSMISKANPENGGTTFALRSDCVGKGVIGDTLFQATESAIYNGDEGTLYEREEKNGGEKWSEFNITTGINDMTGDGSRLVLAYNANAEVGTMELYLNKTIPVVAVQGATRVEARKDGIFAMVKNQMVRVHD